MLVWCSRLLVVTWPARIRCYSLLNSLLCRLLPFRSPRLDDLDRPRIGLRIEYADRQRAAVTGAGVEAGTERAQFGKLRGLVTVDDMPAEIMIVLLPAARPEQYLVRLVGKRVTRAQAGVHEDVVFRFYHGWKCCHPYEVSLHLVAVPVIGRLGFDAAIVEPQRESFAPRGGDHHLLVISPERTPDTGRACTGDEIPHKIDNLARTGPAVDIVAKKDHAIGMFAGMHFYFGHRRAKLVVTAMNIANCVDAFAHGAWSAAAKAYTAAFDKSSWIFAARLSIWNGLARRSAPGSRKSARCFAASA